MKKFKQYYEEALKEFGKSQSTIEEGAYYAICIMLNDLATNQQCLENTLETLTAQMSEEIKKREILEKKVDFIMKYVMPNTKAIHNDVARENLNDLYFDKNKL